jgi:hypothetical protein
VKFDTINIWSVRDNAHFPQQDKAAPPKSGHSGPRSVIRARVLLTKIGSQDRLEQRDGLSQSIRQRMVFRTRMGASV